MKNINAYYKVMNVVEPPLNMMIVGQTACGKTHYLLKMLEKDYKGVFDHIVLICPTFPWNKTYLDWKFLKDPDFVCIPCEQDDVETILNHVTCVYRGTNTLIILDDCAATQSVKNRTGALVNLAFSARHWGLSTIVITQQLTSIAKPYRENIAKLVTFHNSNKNDMKTIVEGYLGGVEKSEIVEICKTLKSVKHSRLEVNLKHPFSHKVCI